MEARRGRRIFVAAFALSLLLHLIFAGYFRWPGSALSSEEAPLTRIRIIRIARAVPTPRPPTPSPRAVPSIAPPKISPQVTGKPERPVVPIATVPAHSTSPPQTATPQPTALPTPDRGPCNGHQNADPTVAATPDTLPDVPPDARASKAKGTAQIAVQLDAQARVTKADVQQSSGNAGLDGVAVQIARAATYTPRYVNCRAVAGAYVYTVRFWTW